MIVTSALNFKSNIQLYFLGPIQYLARLKDNLHESRNKIYSLIAPYKILLFLTCCVSISQHTVVDFIGIFSSGNHTIHIEEVKPILNDKLPDFSEITSDLFTADIFANVNAIWFVLLTHVASSYICYIFGKFACKIHIQTFSFSFPINLTVPLAISALIILCGLREANICVYHDMLPDYMFFHMPPVHFMFTYIFKQFAWIWIFWLFSQTWVARHLWKPRNLRNASTERLFVLPMYDSLIIDQSMALNRRREEFGEFVQCAVRKLKMLLSVVEFKCFTCCTGKGSHQ
jgi:chitin synthase